MWIFLILIVVVLIIKNNLKNIKFLSTTYFNFIPIVIIF